MVSIIIPVYNAEKYLDRCLQSAVNQAGVREVIAVDDGSTDNSVEIIEKYTVKLIKQKNAGSASARNAGLSSASSDYIMFLDSDDYLEEGCVSEIIREVADIVRFKLCYEYPDRSEVENNTCAFPKYVEKKGFKKKIYPGFFMGIQFNSVCRNMYKHSVIKDIRFAENMTTGEDLLFNIEAFTAAASFKYIDKPFYHYRQTNKGLTGQGIPVAEKYRCNIRISAELFRRLKEWDMNSFKYRFLAIARPFVITFLKVVRVLRKR